MCKKKRRRKKKKTLFLSLLVTLLVLPSWIPFEWAQFVLHPTSGGCFAFWFPSFMEFHSLMNNIPVLSFWVCSYERWKIQLAAIWLGVMEGLLHPARSPLFHLRVPSRLVHSVGPRIRGGPWGAGLPWHIKAQPRFFFHSNDERFASMGLTIRHKANLAIGLDIHRSWLEQEGDLTPHIEVERMLHLWPGTYK
jgi:hypothetical protein